MTQTFRDKTLVPNPDFLCKAFQTHDVAIEGGGGLEVFRRYFPPPGQPECFHAPRPLSVVTGYSTVIPRPAS